MGFIATGVPGLDFVLGGGLPESYLVAVSGLPGSGKTILIQQVAAQFARSGGRVLYVTGLSEGHVAIVAGLKGFKFLDPDLLGDRIKIVNILPIARRGLSSVTSAVVRTVSDEKVSLLVFDGFQSLRDASPDERAVRMFLYELAATLTAIKVTVLVIGEQDPTTSVPSPELLAADGVVVMRARWTGQTFARTLEVMKMRGVQAVKGPHSVAIGDDGITVYPRPEAAADAPGPVSQERVPLGTADLDAVLSGGLPAASTTLVLGHPGAGKTLLALKFMATGCRAGEPGVYLSMRRTPTELTLRARRLGPEMEEAQRADRLAFLYCPEATLDPDRLAWDLWSAVDRLGARRVVVDGMAALARVLPPERLAGYLGAVVGHLRSRGATVLITLDAADARAPFGDANPALVAAADNVILMRLEESDDRLRYRLAVTKMSGDHDRSLHEYTPGGGELRLVT